MKEYELKSGPLSHKRKLTLSADFVAYENKGNGREQTKINATDIVDFKHGMDWIVWYKFTVGRKFMVTFKTIENKELKIVFSSYFGIDGYLNQAYADIVEDIWQLYHQKIVDKHLERFYNDETLTLQGVTINSKGIRLDPKGSLLPWDRVSIKEYYSYFAIHDKDMPAVHKRISYNEYETEILWSMIKTILGYDKD